METEGGTDVPEAPGGHAAGAAQDLELGKEYARMLRLMRTLGKLRRVSRDVVMTSVMASKAYESIDSPALTDMDLEQVRVVNGLLEHWIAQARTQPEPKRDTGAAPRAPWQCQPMTEKEQRA